MDKLLLWGMTDTREDAICLDDEFGLMLTKVRIPVPAPKLNYVEIPLSSTVIDFSEFADAIHFEQSVTRLTFVRAAAGTRESWLELWLNIQAAIHGEELHWCFASDESNIYTGRFILSDWLSSGALGTFVLEIHQTRATVEQVTITLADGQGNSESEYVASGDTYTIPASPFTRTGYTWFRWNTAADGSGTDYDAMDTITITESITLYAVWGHVIYYMPNGGTGSMDAEMVVEGDSVILDDCTFTRSGRTFAAWNTAADGSGTDYDAGDTITPSSDVYLYARWEAGVIPVDPVAGDIDTDVTDDTKSGKIINGDTISDAEKSNITGFWYDPLARYYWRIYNSSGNWLAMKYNVTSFSGGVPSVTRVGRYYSALTDGKIVLTQYGSTADPDIGAHWFRIYGGNVMRLEISEDGETKYVTLYKAYQTNPIVSGVWTDVNTGSVYVLYYGYVNASSSGSREYFAVDIAADGTPTAYRMTGSYDYSSVDGMMRLLVYAGETERAYTGVRNIDAQTGEHVFVDENDATIIKLRDLRPRGLSSVLTAGTYKSENGDTLVLTGDWTNGMTATLNGAAMEAAKIMTSQGVNTDMPDVNDDWNPSGDWSSRGKLAMGELRYNVNMLSDRVFLFEDVSTGDAVVWGKAST